MSKLYFRYGAMNSGKSTALLQVAYNYEERGQRVIILKPSIDTKSTHVLSRIGASRKVDVHVDATTEVRGAVLKLHELSPLSCVIVDEAQFLSPEQVNELFQVAVKDGIPVIAYGLRTDFQTKAFPGSMRLMELAHSLEEMKTICRCGRKALFNGRKSNGEFVADGAQVAIDGEEVEYESLCGSCYISFIKTP